MTEYNVSECLEELRAHRNVYLKNSSPWRIVNRAIKLIVSMNAELEALRQKEMQENNKQEWNTGCGYYRQKSDGERICSCGMDMTFCTKRCAFATNVKGSTRAYEAPTTLNYRRVGGKKK